MKKKESQIWGQLIRNVGRKTNKRRLVLFPVRANRKMCRINNSFLLFFFYIHLPWLHLCIIVFLLFFSSERPWEVTVVFVSFWDDNSAACWQKLGRWRIFSSRCHISAQFSFSFLSCCCTWIHRWGRLLGIFRSVGQVCTSPHSADLQASFQLKLMYTEIQCEAQALANWHANANISVPLVM